MYCVQPLMPELSHEFQVSAAASSLSLSLTTGVLAIAMLVAGSMSESLGRKPIMAASLLASALLTIGTAFAPGWSSLLALRALEGITFAGLPAIAMAYLGEEMHPRAIGLAMGLYIGGTGLGGMTGRLLTGVLTDFVSWRFAIGAIGALGVVAAAIFWRSLPPSRHFRARPLVARHAMRAFADHLRDRRLLALFAEGFLAMGGFVTVYNYISYRLLAPPYRMTQTHVGLIFGVYLVGIGSSAWMGALAGRAGRARVLRLTIALMLAGVALTLARPVIAIVLGIALVTFGFFGAHSVASSWVGLRATRARAQAASLYLFFYYMGSSIAGACGGLFWSAHAWTGVAAFVGTLLVAALVVALTLPRAPGAADA
jgi:YNFM family putative membrane transporter